MNRVKEIRIVQISFSILSIITFAILAISLQESNAERIHNTASILGLINVLVICYSSGKMVGKRFNELSVWYLIYYIFLESQNILYVFGYKAQVSTSSIFKLMTVYELANSVIYTNILLSFISIGATWCLARNAKAIISEQKAHDPVMLRTARTTSIILFAPAMYYMVKFLSLASTLGYQASFDGEFSNSLLTMFCRYALFGWQISLFGILHATNKKRESRLVCFALFALVLCYFSVGERTFPISILICVIFATNADKHNKRKKRAILIVPVAYILLVIVSLIQQVRGSGIITIDSLVSAFTSFDGGLQAALESIGIMGFSSCCLPLTMRLIGREGFKLGTTYLFGMTTFIPNILNIFGSYSLGRYSLSRWLKNGLGLTWGPGFSMPAEAYINFGWIGVVIGLILGYLLAKFVMVKKSTAFEKTISTAIYYCILTLPRRYLGSAISDITMGILPIILVYYLYGGFKKKGNFINESSK